MRTLVILLVGLFVCSQTVIADDRQDVKDIVKENIDIVISLVKDKSLDKETRNKKIIDTVVPFFDFEFMAKICLGKKHWQSMNKEKQEIFVDRFVKMLQDSYLEKLDLYTDEEVVVEEAKRVKSRIYVVTHLVSKDDEMEMVYKFWNNDGKWLVYDIEIIGVSIVKTYRSQFDGFLRDNSVDDLLEKLEDQKAFKTNV